MTLPNEGEVLTPQDLGMGLLFESIRDAVIVADTNTGKIVLWNSAAEAIFGYSTAEALGMSVEELVPDYLKVRHRAGLAGYRDTGRGRYIDSDTVLDLPAVRKTGEEIHVELTLSPIEPVREAAAKGRFVLAIVRDSDDRKRAEEELSQSQQRYRLVARVTNEAMWDSDLLADRQRWDGAFETIFGYPLSKDTNSAWWRSAYTRRIGSGCYRTSTMSSGVWGTGGWTSTASGAPTAPTRRSSTEPTWCATQKVSR